MKKIVICGLGSIGRRHFRVIKKFWPDIKIGVYRSGKGENNPESLVADKIFRDLENAISWEPDAAIIASPATFHFLHSIHFIRKGIPLLIEKPLDSDLNKFHLWQDINKDLNNKILIGYLFRHDPAFIKIKTWIKEIKIGTIKKAYMKNVSWLPDWRPSINYKNSVSAKVSLGGGILLEQSHDIDLAKSLFGNLKVDNAIVSNSKLLDIEVEDRANISFLNQENIPINIEISFCNRNIQRSLYIEGSEGSIKWNIKSGILSLKEREFFYKESFNTDANERIRIQFQHFLNVCNKKDIPLVSLEDSLDTLKLIREIRKFKK